jgi:hypothetical protein
MRVIELRVNRLAFAASMGEMRGWSDRNRFSEVGFQTATEGSEILIRLEFPTSDMAAAFQQEFCDRPSLPSRRAG